MYKNFRNNLQTASESTDAVVSRSLSNLSDISVNKNENKETIEDPTVIKTVSECWEKVDTQCLQYGRDDKYSSSSQGSDGWKTVRIFVSSTFTDFFCEREILVKKVFPELREWCHARMLYLVDCDMRWGVPRDTTTSDTIVACLEELDRCLEETCGKPFFLNLLGERYGWIPALEDISAEVKEKYCWVPNTSITFMEILYGSYRMQSPNALFMHRDGGVIETIPEKHISRYQDADKLSKHHLKQLKTLLQSRFPDQFHKYMCHVEGVFTKYDREYVNIIGLEEFSEHVLQFFKSAIEKTFPDRDHVQQLDSPVLIEEANQKRVLEELAGSLIGRQKEADLLLSFASGQTDGLSMGETNKPFSRVPDYWGEKLSSGSAPLCLSAGQGYGKTTLLAWLAQQAIKRKMRIFYHFCDVTGSSTNESLLLQRLISFFSNVYSSEQLEELYQCDNSKLRDMLKDQLLSLDDARQTVIILDGLDQLSSSNHVNHLSWLPPSFPENVHCLVSTTTHPPTVSRIREHPHYSLTLEPLTNEDASNITELLLQKFNKKLDKDQTNLIMSSKCSQSPLWLYFVCEEMRVYGDFRTLTKQMKAVTSSIDGMIEAILQRMVTEDDTGYIDKTLCILACQHGVITARDLQRMLGNMETKEPLPTVVWAKIRRCLYAILRTKNYNEQLVFVHNSIKMVMYKTMIATKDAKLKWNTVLADYIEYWSEDLRAKTEDLTYHLKEAQLKQRLVHFIREVPESSSIPQWKRSNFMSDCRCHNLADSVIKNVVPVYICQFCQQSKAVYHPGNFHRNKDMCVVCGNHVMPGVPHTTDAYLCQFHQPGGGIHPAKCFLCAKIIPEKKWAVHGRLCLHCGFGNNGKRCAAMNI